MTLAERDTEKSNDLSTDLHSQAPVDADTLAMRRLKLWIRMLGVTRQVENQLGLLRSVELGTEWRQHRLTFPAHSVAGGRATEPAERS